MIFVHSKIVHILALNK